MFPCKYVPAALLAAALLFGSGSSNPHFAVGPTSALAQSSHSDQDWDHDYHHHERGVTFLYPLPVPGTSATNPFSAFDIIFVKPRKQLMSFSSRSSKAVVLYDVFNDTPVGSTAPIFAGQGSNNPHSGPNGTLIAGHQLWAGDYPSTIRVFDLSVSISSPPEIAAIDTGGTLRANEMDYDPKDHIVLVTNSNDTPPFVNLVSTKTLTITKQVVFDGTNGTVDATVGGTGGVLYDSKTGKFLVAIPQVGSDVTKGAVVELDPITGAVTHVFYGTDNCQAAGMAEGPGENVLVGCDPGFPPPATPSSGTAPDYVTFAPRTYVINGRTGKIRATITQVGGEDEVWYNPGDHHYYTGSRDFFTGTSPSAATPVLGVIDADTNQWIENVPTGPNSHSVAANPLNDHIYVPLKNPNTLCGSLPGCIGVFRDVQHHDHDHDRDHDGK